MNSSITASTTLPTGLGPAAGAGSPGAGGAAALLVALLSMCITTCAPVSMRS